MKKSLTTLSILFILLAFITPTQASAAISAGVKPGSFFYFFDITFENISIFFTFNPEKKARKALEYADERLAEAEAVANENKPEAVATAMAIYQTNISLATAKSKEIKDDKKSEELLNTVSENTAKHQEVLASVLEKVPEEARQAILNAIEVSKKGQEEAVKQITELKSEIEKLKNEVVELKAKDEERGKVIEELGKQKSETIPIPTKPQTSPAPETTQTSGSAIPTPSQATTKVSEPQSIPSVSQPLNNTNNITPPQTTQPTPSEPPKIISVNVSPSLNSISFDWETNVPTESKVFVSGSSISTIVAQSLSGFSTHHIATVPNLSSGTSYNYNIEAISESVVSKTSGTFSTINDKYEISVSQKETAGANGYYGVGFTIKILKNGSQIKSPLKVTAPVTQSSTPENPDTLTLGSFASDGITYLWGYAPRSSGIYTITFFVPDLDVSKSVIITAKPFDIVPPTVSLSFDNPTGGNIIKGEKEITVLGLNIENSGEANVQINNLKLRLVGTSFSNLQNLKIKIGTQLYSAKSTNGDIKTYNPNYILQPKFSIQILVQADVALTANSDSFHIEVVEVSGVTMSGNSINASDIITGNTFTIYQPPLTDNSPTISLAPNTVFGLTNNQCASGCSYIGTILRFDAKNNPFSILKLALTFNGVNESDIRNVKLLWGGNVYYKLYPTATNSRGQKAAYIEGNKIIFQNFSLYELFHVNQNEILDLTVKFEANPSGIGKTIQIDLVNPITDIVASNYETGLVLSVGGSAIGFPILINKQ